MQLMFMIIEISVAIIVGIIISIKAKRELDKQIHRHEENQELRKHDSARSED